MNVNEIYASNSEWLKAEHLPQGKEIRVTIESDEVVELDGKKKLAIRFAGKEKALVLNKTNSTTIAAAYGPESTAWRGKVIFLYSTKVDYAGQMVDAVRVRAQLEQAAESDDINW